VVSAPFKPFCGKTGLQVMQKVLSRWVRCARRGGRGGLRAG
jgi:hypothetical protein